MKTQITCTSRLEVLNVILKLERYDINYTENKKGIIADITPEKAWSINLI